jgi:hypothetical protein
MMYENVPTLIARMNGEGHRIDVQKNSSRKEILKLLRESDFGTLKGVWLEGDYYVTGDGNAFHSEITDTVGIDFQTALPFRVFWLGRKVVVELCSECPAAEDRFKAQGFSLAFF